MMRGQDSGQWDQVRTMVLAQKCGLAPRVGIQDVLSEYVQICNCNADVTY